MYRENAVPANKLTVKGKRREELMEDNGERHCKS